MTLEEFISKEIDHLDRSIVATPSTRERLDNFAKGNKGCMDALLTQMAVQYGYLLALESVKEIINKK